MLQSYLSEDKLKKLNNLTTLFLDYVKDMIEEQSIIAMQKRIDIIDELISFKNKKILSSSVKILHKQVMKR